MRSNTIDLARSERALAAQAAGRACTHAAPMSRARRLAVYQADGRALTDRQRRRLNKKTRRNGALTEPVTVPAMVVGTDAR